MPKRERVYRAEGVVLRRFDLGEADRLTTIFTRHYGKLRLIAKGVRKPGSRKAGHLEPFTRVALMMARGREIDLITQAEAIDSYPQLRSDLYKLGHASYLVELLDRFTLEEGESNDPVYNLLVNSLTRLASTTSPPSGVILYFELRLLELLGYRPELFRCVECSREIRPEDQYFSAHQGGVVCPRCGRTHKDTRSITLPALKLMRHFQRSNFERAVAPRVSQQIQSEVEATMLSYITYLLERRLNTPGFIRRIRDFDGEDGVYQAESSKANIATSTAINEDLETTED
jgi:DNA repair protein RecO (recombination protein O)